MQNITRDQIIDQSKYISDPIKYDGGDVVYFLINNAEIIYIGKTTNFNKRILNHIWDDAKKFNKYFLLESENLTIDERYYIQKMNPLLNKTSTKGKSENETKVFSTRIDLEIAEKFKKLAESENMNMSDYLERVIKIHIIQAS